VIVLTSNRGLAGAFNANLIREARGLVERLEREGAVVDLHVVGRKGAGYFRYVGRAMATTRTDLTDRPTGQDAADLVSGPMAGFVDRTLDAVYVVYARFVSALTTPPTTDRILPVTPPSAAAAGSGSAGAPGPGAGKARQHDYILVPSAEAILEELLPAYVRNSVYRALVETAAAEQGARRTAMKSATDNANDVINGLRRQYNRARQAQITQEIAEIVGGAAALGG
jgi:F-type H+-transporting ATPase subunit gamma